MKSTKAEKALNLGRDYVLRRIPFGFAQLNENFLLWFLKMVPSMPVKGNNLMKNYKQSTKCWLFDVCDELSDSVMFC